MSQANVELVRTMYAVWTGQQGADEALALLAEDFEWVNPHYALEPGTRHGHAGWLTAMGNLKAAFHEHGHEVHEVRDLGDRVLAFTTFVAQTNPDGPAFRQDEPHLWSLRDGQVIRFQWFHDRAEVLKAAGLSE
ncbi:MAG: nuclear transport factor 2 family protein [Solirubrobacteraceae bacterium]